MMRTSQWIPCYHLFDASKADTKLQSGLRLRMNVDTVALLLCSKSLKQRLNSVPSPFHRLGVSLRAGLRPTTCPLWCRCPAMLTPPSSRPAQAAPSGCRRRARCSGTSNPSRLVVLCLALSLLPEFIFQEVNDFSPTNYKK